MSNIDTIKSRLALHEKEFTEMIQVVSAMLCMNPATLVATVTTRHEGTQQRVLADRFAGLPVVVIAMAPYLEEEVAIFSFEYIERQSKSWELKHGMFIIHGLESIKL